jgi:hypothetical protein
VRAQAADVYPPPTAQRLVLDCAGQQVGCPSPSPPAQPLALGPRQQAAGRVPMAGSYLHTTGGLR